MTQEELLEKYAAGVRDFTGINLSEANLRGANLSGANFSTANLSLVNFSGANLTEVNFTQARLNVARLSAANMAGSNFNNASLNVANLIRANLSRASLIKASLIRTELIRADLSRSDLREANLTGADLREAKLRLANLRRANLSEANLRGSSLTGVNFEQANLNNTEMARVDLSGANLRGAELRQVNLSRANLSGANLSGANLRWADLTGATLRWADLSNAKLSGANLIGADLRNANLTNSSLVHADLTQATLIKAEWVGADLSGATLTGAKLYAVSRFGLRTEGMTCEWIDLSPSGDHSIVQYFNSEESRAFFNETPPTIRIIIDAALDHAAYLELANSYYQIAQQYPGVSEPPSIEIGRRRTELIFRVDSDAALFATAYMLILPFKDAATTQQNIFTIVQTLMSQNLNNLGIKLPNRLKDVKQLVEVAILTTDQIKNKFNLVEKIAKINFFNAPTQTILTNSSAQTLMIHYHPHFGKHFINQTDGNLAIDDEYPNEAAKFHLPSVNKVVDFVKKFYYMEN
ncbi:MAG: pentapeptide repeat-containing protein [Nostocaceae cyanobacterium]|nr:pentapeptide repeat-containing protein [Nostocaceae cyanobacterium]